MARAKTSAWVADVAFGVSALSLAAGAQGVVSRSF